MNQEELKKLAEVSDQHKCSLNVAAYILYVQGTLQSIPKTETVRASYDTGFGLSLTNEDLGTSPMTLFVKQCEVGKVLPPRLKGDEWDEAWEHGKMLVREFIHSQPTEGHKTVIVGDVHGK